MRNKRLLIVMVVVLTLFITWVLTKADDEMDELQTARTHQHIHDVKETDVLDQSTDTTAEGFKTHLPLVILNTNGQKIMSKLDTDGDCRINIQVQIIDNEDELNKIGDTPAIDTISSIRHRGNSSLYYDKKQYGLKFFNEDGTDHNVEVMGMEAGSEWVLNGTFLDKSLIRNYLAYNISGEIMDYAPNLRFCEVFIYDGEAYTYQGLYTMIESVERAVSRVNISKYDEERVESAYIIRRDRFSEDEIMLYNYATQNQLTKEWLGVKYPSESKLTKETLEYIENDISKFEKVLYSDDYETFMTYTDYIDVDSFVDYYVINEFFGNYDAGLHSTYAHKDLTGKLTMGPVWDFDSAMDNASPWELDTDAVAFQSAPWFDALVKDEKFCQKVNERYKELRKSYFSDLYINQYIDETVAYLGKALERDQLLWGYVFEAKYLNNEENCYGVVNDRNVDTYDEEIQRMKLALHKHAEYLDGNFYYDIMAYHMPKPETMSVLVSLALLFVISFFIIVIIVRQE